MCVCDLSSLEKGNGCRRKIVCHVQKQTNPEVHSKTPHVVTVLWQDSDDVVTILSPTRNLVDGYKTMYLCHLDSYRVSSVFPSSDRAVEVLGA